MTHPVAIRHQPIRRLSGLRRLVLVSVLLAATAAPVLAQDKVPDKATGRPDPRPSPSAPDSQAERVRQMVEASFPNTRLGSVSCEAPLALCEVTAGKTVFYVSRDARYAVLGTLLDLKARINLTERRVQELASLEAAMARIGGPEPAPPSSGPPSGERSGEGSGEGARDAPARLEVRLSRDNAIIYHPGAALKLTAFTDFNCHFCRQLFDEIAMSPDIELTEYPMSFLAPTSADKARRVLCSPDRTEAARATYAGDEPKVVGTCDRAAAAVE